MPAEPTAQYPSMRSVEASERRATAPWLPMPPGQVLVLGARGRLGYSCVQAFSQAGWRVLAHVRSASTLLPTSKDAAPASGVHWLHAALDDVGAWQAAEAVHGTVDVVVNAMAPAFSTTAWGAELAKLQDAAIAQAQRHRALLLQPLSVLAYGTPLPDVLYEGEDLPPKVTTRLGQLRAQTEHVLRQSADAGLSVCTLRLGTLYGHTGWGWISGAVAKHLRSGRMHWLGPYDVATPWAYVDDVARTLVCIAEQRQQLDLWTPLHFAGHPRTGSDWQAALAQAAVQHGWISQPATLQARQVRWGWWRPIGWISPVVRALREMEYVWRSPHRLDNQSLLRLIGSEPATPWERSVANTVSLLARGNDLY